MRLSLPLLTVLLAGCGLNQPRFEERFQERYCTEYEACFDDFSCFDEPLERDDFSSCTFSQEDALACLENDWFCVTTDGPAYVSIPAACASVYSNCGTTPSSGTTTTIITTPTGTTTPTGSR